jgi:hydroxymethylpyrimidine pyrophosphatase-like HAD family hydrolase
MLNEKLIYCSDIPQDQLFSQPIRRRRGEYVKMERRTGENVGRPYQKDLDGLVATAEWADNVDVSALTESLACKTHLPLVAVGSGGSRTVACLSAMLHRHYTGQAAEDTTPLLVSGVPIMGRAIQLFTASGGNPDVLGCFSRLVTKEPETLTIVSSASSSPLALKAENFWFTNYFGFDGPVQGEGFVATNSILAQAIVMTRAYEGAFGISTASVASLLTDSRTDGWLTSMEEAVSNIGLKPHVVVLFGEFSMPAAVDLESKFSEVGLASVQLADFRNFAHGRHNWIDKNSADTLVISIEVGDDSRLAKRTLHLLPASTSILRITIDEQSTMGALLAMYAVMRLTGIYGKLRGLDPGRPGVPAYGSRLYRLNAWRIRDAGVSIPEISVVRKAQTSLAELRRTGDFDSWIGHFWSFVEILESQKFSALALDYDGTLCDQRDRFRGISDYMQMALVKVLKKHVPVTIVTGRGRSVGESLRNALPKCFWSAVKIAYYNGSELHLLDYEGVLDDTAGESKILKGLKEKIQTHPRMRGINMEVRRSQLTISASAYVPADLVHRIASDILSAEPIEGARVVTSTHSVDVLLATASKVAPLSSVERHLHHLCIGDSGCWPGNDFELLAQTGSLSVHRSSHLMDRCWHISPAGWRNSQSTLHYLASLRHSSFGFQIDRERLLSTRP